MGGDNGKPTGTGNKESAMTDGTQKKLKICFAASSGGHLEEISRLTGVKEGRDCFLITEKSDFSDISFCENVYYVNQINRKQVTFIPCFIQLFFRCRKILRTEKADCVLTTGALMGYAAALAGKLMGKKIIYIESFARVDTASLTGRMIHPIADLFIVQWEDGLKFFPKAVYGGAAY